MNSTRQVYLCGAMHDQDLPDIPMISSFMRLGAYAWICARASVEPDAKAGDGAVLASGVVARRNHTYGYASRK